MEKRNQNLEELIKKDSSEKSSQDSKQKGFRPELTPGTDSARLSGTLKEVGKPIQRVRNWCDNQKYSQWLEQLEPSDIKTHLREQYEKLSRLVDYYKPEYVESLLKAADRNGQKTVEQKEKIKMNYFKSYEYNSNE